MRFATSAGPLRDALTRARQLIPATPTLVAYSGVLLQVETDADGVAVLRVTSSDGDSTMTVTLEVDDATPGQALLTPRPILGFLASVPADCTVVVSLEPGGDLSLSGEGLNPYTFRPLSATFPLPTSPAPGVRPDGLGRLADALALIRSAAGRDTPVVQLVSDGDQLALHATDGFRLARTLLVDAGFGTFTGVLPLAVLERIARTSPEEVTVDLRGRTLAFRGEATVVTSRLLATPFPAVETVLSTAPPQMTSFDPVEVSRALARLSAIAEQGTVALEFTGSELTLRASATEIGAGHEVVGLLAPVPSTFQIQLRAPYLQDAVASLKGDTVAVAYSGSLQPLYLAAAEPFPVTHVVMPVRA